MFRRKAEVQSGQRFRPLAFPWLEWEVEEVFADPAGRPHAKLVLAGDPTTRKTVACALLLDGGHFMKAAA